MAAATRQSTWNWLSLGQAAILKTGPFGSALHSSDYIRDGVPVINPMHIRDGRLWPTAEMTVDRANADRLSEFRLQAGDVVMGRRGDAGRCAVVPLVAEGWICGTGSLIIRPRQEVNPRFLQLILSSSEMVQQITSTSVGTTMVNLNQVALK